MKQATEYIQTPEEATEEAKKIAENIERVKNNTKLKYNIGDVRVSENMLNLIKEMESEYPEMTREFKKIMISNYFLFLKKQKDYGPQNISMNTQLKTKEDKQMSLIGLVTRMNDKMSRLVNLIFKNKTTVNESIIDSFIDISNYGIIANIVSNEKWGK